MPSGRRQSAFAGFCVYWKPDGIADYDDLGEVESLTPNFEQETGQQFDGRTGRRVVVHEQQTSFEMTFEVSVSRASMRNFARTFAANPPEALVQTTGAVTQIVAAAALRTNGPILQANDGTNSLRAVRVAAIFDDTATETVTPNEITAVNAATKQVTFATLTPAPASRFAILEGPNAGTYTVVSFAAGVAVVAESLSATEAAVTWDAMTVAATGASLLVPGTDYIYDNSVGNGMIEFLATSNADLAITNGMQVRLWRNALSGNRRVRPLTATTAQTGTLYIVMVAENGAVSWAGEFRASLTPGSPQFEIENPSTFTYNFTVTYDSSATNPGGVWDKFFGALEVGG